MDTFSKNLIGLARVRSGLTQAELARRAGTSQAAISSYESGRRSPSVETLQRIISAAGFEIRVRLEKPDNHDKSRIHAEGLLPADQVAAHYEAERARVSGRGLLR